MLSASLPDEHSGQFSPRPPKRNAQNQKIKGAPNMPMTRRDWLRTTTGTAGAVALHALAGGGWSPRAALADDAGAKNAPKPLEIGCFNRPWSRWSYDEALDALKECGVRLTGLVGGHKGELFIAPQASAEYLDQLKARIESRGLVPIVAWYDTRHDVPRDESIRNSRKQIDNAHRLGLKFLLSGATSKPEQYAQYYEVMADAAAYAEDRGIQIVVKPHGGCAASSDDLLVCLEKVNHPNYRIWYDAGNIIHYTGKDPVAEAAVLARHSTGFCAKDCAMPKGDVMLQFGEGKVDFPAVFARLKEGGFTGPVMIECCGGKTLPEVTAAAKANREFLERVLRAG
jgi:sugar phosphate isomerase/epimerase